MRVLVTGSSGQLGAEVCRQLSEAHAVTGLDVAPGPFTQVLGAVEDRSLVFEQVAQVDAVVHVASLHAPHRDQLPKERFVDVNVRGALHLLEAAVAHRCRRFIYTSTTSVYGRAMEPRGHSAVWVTEELTPQPRDIYDVTKLAAEQLCHLIHEEHGLPIIILRTSRFYPQPFEVLAVHRLHRGLDVRDCAWAHRLALESQAARPPAARAAGSRLRHLSRGGRAGLPPPLQRARVPSRRVSRPISAPRRCGERWRASSSSGAAPPCPDRTAAPPAPAPASRTGSRGGRGARRWC